VSLYKSNEYFGKILKKLANKTKKIFLLGRLHWPARCGALGRQDAFTRYPFFTAPCAINSFTTRFTICTGIAKEYPV
jgi:hypothetical protein